jgi:hypothetical protein
VVRFIVGDFVKVLEKNHRGFSPNNFDYYVTMGDEMSELKKFNEQLFAFIEKNFTEEDYDGNRDIHYDPSNLVSFDASTNTFTYSIERGGIEAKLTVERVVSVSSDFKNYGMLF